MPQKVLANDFNNDGRPDYLVGVNDDRLIPFENQSQNKFIAIRLPELAKEQNYIGAKIKVLFMDNSIQLHEIFAGSGYLCLLYTSPSPRDRG